MKTAIYPGSFDPVTYGHLEIISRASKLFDKVIVLVSVNPLKPCSFTIDERKQFLRESVVAEGIGNVEVDSNEGPVSYTHLDVYKRQASICISSYETVLFFIPSPTDNTSARFIRPP